MELNGKINRGYDEDERPISMHLKDLGLRTDTNLIYYLAVENTYDSNLISDIRNVSYIENSNGLMYLKRLDGIPFIFDDIYIFSYVFPSDVIKSNRGGITLKGDSKNSDGEKITGVAKRYLDIAKHDTINTFNGINCYDARIFTTAQYHTNSKSDLLNTMNLIDSDGTILKNSQKWQNQINQDTVGVVGIKINVSNIPFDIVNDGFDKLNEVLKLKGFVIGKCDITYDQAGTLDVPALYQAFLNNGNTREEEEKPPEYDFRDIDTVESTSIFKLDYDEKRSEYDSKDVLINLRKEERKSGRNILKYTTVYRNQTIRCKYYNKLVSNFEAGNTQKKMGVHLVEYAYNHQSPYLKKVFDHPDVIVHGLTRFELSFCPSLKLKINAKRLILSELNKVGTLKIFHSQPKVKQFELLRDTITKSCLICDRTKKEISMIWYGTSLTQRIACVNYHVFKRKEETEEDLLKRYDHAKKEVMSEFGFNNLVINVVEFERGENDSKLIHFFKPKCYSRRGSTFLTPTNQPTKNYGLHEDLPDITEVCPSSEDIQFVFRKEKNRKARGERSILNKPRKLEDHTFDISLISTRKRKEILEQIDIEYRKYIWYKKNEELKQKLKEEEEKRKLILLKEKESLKILMEKQERADERRKTVEKDFKRFTRQEEVLKEITEHKFIEIYAFKIGEYNDKTKERSYRILFKYGKTDKKGVCFPTKALKRWLLDRDTQNTFFKEVVTKNKKENIFCMPIHSLRFYLFQNQLVFGKNEDEMIAFKTKFKKSIDDITNAIERFKEIEKELIEVAQPLLNLPKPRRSEEQPRDLMKVEPGEYEVDAFSEYDFRGVIKKILYIKTEEGRFPVTGYYLQEQLDKKIKDLSKVKTPLKLFLDGSSRHPKKGKQDRQVELYHETI